jgi:uncharacterized protein (DUF58 family)
MAGEEQRQWLPPAAGRRSDLRLLWAVRGASPAAATNKAAEAGANTELRRCKLPAVRSKGFRVVKRPAAARPQHLP